MIFNFDYNNLLYLLSKSATKISQPVSYIQVQLGIMDSIEQFMDEDLRMFKPNKGG